MTEWREKGGIFRRTWLKIFAEKANVSRNVIFPNVTRLIALKIGTEARAKMCRENWSCMYIDIYIYAKKKEKKKKKHPEIKEKETPSRFSIICRYVERGG